MPIVLDARQRVGVLLYRSDRPITKFFCPICRNFVAELAGTDVRALTDIISDISGVGVRCNGSVQKGEKCHRWYYFSLGGD